MMRAGTIAAFLSLATGVGCASNAPPAPVSAADAADTPAAAPPRPEVTTSPVQTPDGGFALDVAKSIRPPGESKARASQGLEVTYSWDGGSSGTAMVIDHGDSWRVIFPSTPEPDALATLMLEYEFDLDAEAKAKVTKLATALQDHVIKAVQTALDDTTVEKAKEPAAFEAAFEAKFSTAMSEASNTLSSLSDYRGSGDQPGGALVLESLGITGKAGAYEVDADKLRAISALRDQATAYADFASKWEPLAKGSVCLPPGQPEEASSGEDLKAAFETCRNAYATLVKSLAVKARASGGDNVRDGQELESLVARLSELEWKPGAAYAEKQDEEYAAEGLIRELEPKIAALEGKLGEKLDRNQPRASMLWASGRGSERHFKQLAGTQLTAPIDRMIVELTQQQAGKVLIEKSAERRYWDVATGAVYVKSLDDVLTPMMIAFCPGGCSRKGEHMLKSWSSFGRALSLDVGTRVGVWDNDTDPRHLDRPSFLLGGSLNPFYFLRGSFGWYTFDNAQSGEWNSAWYAGVTLNLIHASDFLGALGLTPPEVKATPEPANKAPEESD